MTSDSNSLDDRLAQLAARRASAAPRPKTTGAEPDNEKPRRSKRAHPAGTGRVLAASLSTSAFLSIVTALSAQSAPSGAATVKFTNAAPPRKPTHTTTPTTVVVKTVHHKVYVDANGNPVATLPIPASSPAVATAPQATTYRSQYTWSAPRRTAYSGYSNAPAYRAPAPVYVAPSQASSHPSAGPSPAPVPAPVAPAPTKAPAPPPTSPPTTAYHAPAPPPPPPCTGSKCP